MKTAPKARLSIAQGGAQRNPGLSSRVCACGDGCAPGMSSDSEVFAPRMGSRRHCRRLPIRGRASLPSPARRARSRRFRPFRAQHVSARHPGRCPGLSHPALSGPARCRPSSRGRERPRSKCGTGPTVGHLATGGLRPLWHALAKARSGRRPLSRQTGPSRPRCRPGRPPRSAGHMPKPRGRERPRSRNND